MTNFDFLTKDKQFDSFSGIAVAAEKTLHIDLSTCIINCRRAMEMAVKWMYSVDGSLELPYDERLVSLMNNEDFRDIVGNDIWRRMKLIRELGNHAAHEGKKFSVEQATLCLENLYIFMDFIACCYGEEYVPGDFNLGLLEESAEEKVEEVEFIDVDLKALIAENESLKAELTSRRESQQQTYVPKPLDISEYKTRKIYIDFMLQDAGWIEGKDWVNEYELPGMPNKSEVGFADYVLFGDDGKPLAVIEAKRTCVDVSKGRQQAKLYADILEKQYGRRPAIFLTNGFDTRITDNLYPERKCATIYSKRDLEKLFNLQTMRTSLNHVMVNKEIAGRYYQEGAIKAVCDSFGKKNRRKALLVMATGSGKTRTVIALCDVLLQHGWVKNILFLADRNSLVTQAKRSFYNMLPDLSVTNLCEEKDNYNAHCVFSTYQTMMNCIDSVKDEKGKLFTCGHFDLVICDEAHRSIYNKYRDIFNYFDAPLVGLTATPKDEIDKNTYEVFELENGVPTYGYELADAVKDGYLVDFMSVETKLKFIEQGIVYDDLSDEDKEEYESTFARDGELPESIGSSALNEWIFNEDTIKEVLNVLMTNGIKIDYGERIGKTIIFAKNHRHAEKIFEVFNKEYPHLNGYAKVIDNKINYAQTAIDEFSDPKKLPQIAISVDMLDTGIDVPQVVNLVFFKKVMSKAKFWQMIGRGTRLCKGLIDGKDKDIFYIFDFCGNFEFFRMNSKGKEVPATLSVQERIFNLKTTMLYKLQDLAYQTDALKEFRTALQEDVIYKIKELNRDNFAVKQHLKYIDMYADAEKLKVLTPADLQQLKDEVAPLILPYNDEINAVRFDALIYAIELGYIIGNTYKRGKKDLKKKVRELTKIATIPEVVEQSEIFEKILHTDYLETADINDFEIIREKLRDLIKYIPDYVAPPIDIDMDDDIINIDWKESELGSDDLVNYRMKVNHYIRNHMDSPAIAKLHTNQPLTAEDIKSLEKILWSELGTKDDYANEYQDKPLGELVREIVGLDMNTAKEAFSKYLNDVNLDDRQIYFVNQIINYIVQNGMMKDMSVMQEAPFTDNGTIVDIFTDAVVWTGIMKIIKSINANAIAA